MNDSNDRQGFGIVPRHLRGTLTAIEIAVYVALTWRADENGCSFPSHKTLAAEAGASERTIQRALATLRDRGLVTWEQRRDESGSLTSNLYRISVHSAVPPGVTESPPWRQGDATLVSVWPSNENQKNENQRKKAASPWPDGFTPDADLVAWTRKNAPSIDPKAEWAMFRDHALAKDLRYVDWRRAWMTWARRAEGWAAKRGPARSKVTPVVVMTDEQREALARYSI